jgi:hypothetical protein
VSHWCPARHLYGRGFLVCKSQNVSFLLYTHSLPAH